MTIFCSLRLFPAQAIEIGIVCLGKERMSFMVSVIDLFTKPVISKVWLLKSSFGTGPWLRTKCSSFGVSQPSFSKEVKGGSI